MATLTSTQTTTTPWTKLPPGTGTPIPGDTWANGTNYLPSGAPDPHNGYAPPVTTTAPAPFASPTGPGPELGGITGNSPSGVGSNASTEAQTTSDNFQQALPGYLNNQYSSATDQAKMNLANDIQSNNASYNSRGLLYSGLAAGGQAGAAATEGSNLASNIEGINSNAAQQGTTLEENAVQEAANNAQYQTSIQSLQATEAQSAYQQALEEQTGMNSFYASLIGAGAGAGGNILASAIGKSYPSGTQANTQATASG